MKEIIQMQKPILREKTQTLDISEIESDSVQQLIADMQEVLATQNDGVALAAPQIAESYRLFVVAPFVFEKESSENLVYINPRIIESSQETDFLHEGCLSCRWKVGEVERFLSATVEAYDEYGNKFIKSADGLLAHIFQHEIDHLDGILFVDKAQNLRDMTQEEINEC